MYKFKNVALSVRQNSSETIETFKHIYAYLKTKGIDVYIDTTTAEICNDALKLDKNKIIEPSILHQYVNLLIVIGGDGSLLHAAHIAVNQSLPVLGINRGRLGFLTDIKPNDLDKIAKVLNGEYNEEQRFLLDCEIVYENETIHQSFALNDVVLVPGQVVQLIEFNVSIDQQFMCDYRADGLIIATPTGSTAYALSGGGPILHPSLDAIVLVPMFAHTLSSRPIVVQGNSEVIIKIDEDNKIAPCISCDGQERMNTPLGSHIRITKKAEPLHLIHPQEYNYFETLRAKLGWYK